MNTVYNNKTISHQRPAIGTGIIWYRIKKHLPATMFSVIFAFVLIWILFFVVGEIYPDFKLYYKKLPFYMGNDHRTKYNFYSGEDSGVYSTIGRSITNHTIIVEKKGTPVPDTLKVGLFRDGDTLVNYQTGGGFDNFMKVSTEKNSFGLVQEAVINLQDEQLRKGILVKAPLFMERLHIFYRKDLFSNIDADEMQLSANTDPRILKHLTHSVKNIQVGIVGSCTRIIASDVMDLLERQVVANVGRKQFIRHKYKLCDYPLATALRSMQRYKEINFPQTADSVIDIMFLVGADPTKDITNILDSGNYRMMSVHPSFMDLLNKEFKLNLHVADFHKKYDSAAKVNTVGTLSFLIASGDIQSDDAKRLLRKINNSASAIHKSLITLPPGCNDSCYRGISDKCKYILPLAEFGFFKRVEDENIASLKEQTKAIIPFLIAMISLFIPVLKSVNGLKSLWRSWCYNKEIDYLLNTKDAIPEKKLRDLKIWIADDYGDFELSESHFNALTKRIETHLQISTRKVYKRPNKNTGLSVVSSK